MAIALDSASAGQVAGFVTTQTWSHTCTGTNLVLLVAVSSADTTTATVTYGSQTMTQIAQQEPNNTEFEGILSLFGLIGPATGANTVTVTPGSQSDLCSGSVSFTGVSQATGWTNVTNNYGSSTAPSGTVSGVVSGDWAVAAAGGYSSFSSTLTAGTNLWTANRQTGNSENAAMGYLSASGTDTITWSISATGDWGWIGVELPAAATGPVIVISWPQITSRAIVQAFRSGVRRVGL